jgi:hypothetical protein
MSVLFAIGGFLIGIVIGYEIGWGRAADIVIEELERNIDEVLEDE